MPLHPLLNPYSSNTPMRRFKLGLLIFNLGIWAIFLLNGLLPMLNMAEESWQYPDFAPFIKPIGTDFREGYFYPAKVLLQGKSPYIDYNLIYPPFSAVFSVPFRLFNVDQAYLINVILLFALNIACIVLSLSIAYHVFAPSSIDDESGDWHIAAHHTLLLQMAVYAITCYGFLFSVERGNMDSYPLFFSLLALWLLTRPNTSTKELWISTLLIGIATHLKVYPAALFILVIWKYGRKSLLPILLVNLGLFFSTGIPNAVQFAQRISVYTVKPFIWVGNHSAVSFAFYVNSYLGKRLGLQLPSLLFYLLPLTLWALGAWKLWRRGISPANMTWLFLITVPLMSVIPTVSHDYKLVLLTPVFAMLLFWVLTVSRTGLITGQPGRFIALLTLLVLLFIIGRTPVLLPTLLKNKYPFILAVQFITLLGMLKQTSSLPSGR
jgi:hypothetical protein